MVRGGGAGAARRGAARRAAAHLLAVGVDRRLRPVPRHADAAGAAGVRLVEADDVDLRVLLEGRRRLAPRHLAHELLRPRFAHDAPVAELRGPHRAVDAAEEERHGLHRLREGDVVHVLAALQRARRVAHAVLQLPRDGIAALAALADHAVGVPADEALLELLLQLAVGSALHLKQWPVIPQPRHQGEALHAVVRAAGRAEVVIFTGAWRARRRVVGRAKNMRLVLLDLLDDSFASPLPSVPFWHAESTAGERQREHGRQRSWRRGAARGTSLSAPVPASSLKQIRTPHAPPPRGSVQTVPAPLRVDGEATAGTLN